MIEYYRQFEAGPDPFGRTWNVEFRWQQTAISIRHSDSVDVKFQISRGEDVQEKVIALMLPDLMALSKKAGRAISDAWCMKLAALHLKSMIETDKDMEKTLVTASLEDLERANAQLEESVPATT
jgi:hypothetical protein